MYKGASENAGSCRNLCFRKKCKSIDKDRKFCVKLFLKHNERDSKAKTYLQKKSICTEYFTTVCLKDRAIAYLSDTKEVLQPLDKEIQ
jgi:hypothetical protein